MDLNSAIETIYHWPNTAAWSVAVSLKLWCSAFYVQTTFEIREIGLFNDASCTYHSHSMLMLAISMISNIRFKKICLSGWHALAGGCCDYSPVKWGGSLLHTLEERGQTRTQQNMILKGLQTLCRLNSGHLLRQDNGLESYWNVRNFSTSITQHLLRIIWECMMCCRTRYHAVFLTTSHIQRWMFTSAKGPSMHTCDMVKHPSPHTLK